MDNKHKINWLLILQGWAMLWVVIGHSGPSASFDDYPQYALGLWQFAYSFHMPLFIMVSGFLFFLTRIDSPKWTYWTMLREKLLRFGIPFIVFTLVALLMKYLFADSVDRATTLSIGEFVNAILYPYNGPMREFWFLATIMWLFVLFPLWKYALTNKWLTITLIVLLVILNIWHPGTEFLAIRSLCENAVYFFCGIVLATLYQKNPGYLSKHGSASFLFIVGLAIYLTGRLFHIPLFSPIGGASFSLAIALWLDTIYPKAFHSFRNYTYQIYLLGIFFNVTVTIIRARYGLPFTPLQFVSVFLGLYMPVLISIVIEKINWKPLSLCVGLKTK